MAEPGDRLLAAWCGLTRLAAPVGRLIVALRRRAGREHPVRWPERLGLQGEMPPGPRRPVVWVHAASVGETVAVLPLVARIAETGVRVVFTTVTVTSADVAAVRLPAGVVHRFVPVDVAPFVDRFLDAWAPRLAVFVESEMWPVAIARLHARGVPLVVANARMSDRSYRRWRRVRPVIAAMLSRVTLVLAQSQLDTERFAALGAPRVETAGNVKFDAPPPEAPRAAAAALAAAVEGRPVLLAASTHPGEDEIVLAAFARLRARIPELLLVIAPRHPVRGGEIAALAADLGLSVGQRSTGALPRPETAVYVADTVGELGTFYRLATVAFVGGSLVDVGGHNPIEAGRFDAAVVAGPQLWNFRDVYAALVEAGGAVLVEGEDDLVDAVERLVLHVGERGRRIAAARAVVEGYTGALERTLAALRPFLAAAGEGGR